VAYRQKKCLDRAYLGTTTGEVIPVQLRVEEAKGPKLYNWITVFEFGLLRLVECGFTAQELKLALFLIAKCPEDGDIELDRPLIYFYTGIQARNTARAVAALLEAGVLFKARKIGGDFIYKLNPCLAWKRSAARYPDGAYIQTEVPVEWQHNPRVRKEVIE
jgi:hypothetical protein